jgi:small subunit ribosomal protein S8
MLTDPISDYLNRIRNALQAEHEEVEIPASRLKREMTRILKEQGYITDFTVEPARVGEVI